MTDVQVIYDAEREVGAIIDLDLVQALGPICVGPEGIVDLQLFVDRMPPSVFALDRDTLTVLFVEWWGRQHEGDEQPPPEADIGPVVDDGGSADYAQAVEADREAAANGGEPPDPQPADTDVESDQGPQVTVIDCPNCEGAGIIQHENAPDESCTMCAGKGKVTWATTA